MGTASRSLILECASQRILRFTISKAAVPKKRVKH